MRSWLVGPVPAASLIPQGAAGQASSETLRTQRGSPRHDMVGANRGPCALGPAPAPELLPSGPELPPDPELAPDPELLPNPE